jgi:peptidoglycan hydrolase-like protein with peptidoglycan-binding domain
VSRLVRLVGAMLALALVLGGGWWLVRGGVLAGTSGSSGSGSGDRGGAQTATSEPKTATVERRTLTVTEELDATLRYAGEYRVIGNLGGTLTWTVPEGTVVTAGKRLYETNGGDRASLMYGKRPAWRSMAAGMSDGADVLQLERNLKALGYTRAGDEIDRHWDSDTTAAVKRWQKAAGLEVDGGLDLGEVVFLPEAIRVTKIEAALGSGIGPGAPVMTATSNRRVVSLDLDASEADLVAVGKPVEIELPDGSTVKGTVASVGRVAQTSQDQQGGTTTTLPVTITLDDPRAGSGLDEAPVTATVVRSTRENVLTVPVNALVALLEGGYAVEVVDVASQGTAASPSESATPGASSPGGSAGPARTHLVKVEPGLFDHGRVEITATGLQPGDRVVVPS